jgi:hypothetical protein
VVKLQHKYLTALAWTGAAWLIFIGGFLLLCLINFHLSLPEELWFFGNTMLALVAIPILWRGTVCFESPFVRFPVFFTQIVIGCFLFEFMSLVYVIWAQIDSL